MTAPRTIAVITLVIGHVVFAAENPDPDIAPTSPTSLEELLDHVKQTTAAATESMRAREQRFIREREHRAAMLDEVRSKRAAAEVEADRLGAQFEAGEASLAELENQLDEQMGDLRDVFAVVHSTAGDAIPILEGSLVSAQLPGRLAPVERLADKDHLPTAAGIRTLWLTLLDEINESSKTVRFDATVISASGEEETKPVTRIGSFTALADGRYLRYLPESGRLLALARQPETVRASDARSFEQAQAPLMTLPIDPSRGAILALVVQRAGLEERIEQGGIIGYIILVLGALGVVLGVERLVRITRAERIQKRELNHTAHDLGGAVSLMRRATQDPDFAGHIDALSAKMDEIVATAAQRLNRGLPTLALFAAISPLLGLLGTVTGMIETFQVITLFGAGDPRMMSGGISQALITTQLGLAVAIPLLLIHSFVQNRANTQIAVLEETAANLFANEQVNKAPVLGASGA